MADPVVDPPSLQTGQGQEGPLLLHLPWGTASKTLITTRYKMSGSVGLLFTQCQIFLLLNLMCPSRRHTRAKLPKMKAKVLVKRRGGLLLFLLYPGEENMAHITPGAPSCLLTCLFLFCSLRFGLRLTAHLRTVLYKMDRSTVDQVSDGWWSLHNVPLQLQNRSF